MRANLICIGTILHLSSFTSSSWFYNAPHALLSLAGSASSASSNALHPVSLIADLRRRNYKAARLQEEKDPTKVGDEEEEESGDNNEASPSLLQKKIGKILTKVRLIAQLKDAYNYKPDEEDTPSDQSNETSTPKTNSTVTITGIKLFNHSQNIQQIPQSTSTKDEPVKSDLDVEQITDKLGKFRPEKKSAKTSHEPNTLGNIGVFFVELLGSIVGLTYGAMAQLGSGGQNPITVSTSE